MEEEASRSLSRMTIQSKSFGAEINIPFHCHSHRRDQQSRKSIFDFRLTSIVTSKRVKQQQLYKGARGRDCVLPGKSIQLAGKVTGKRSRRRRMGGGGALHALKRLH